jgi:hypothetical protein
MFTDSELAVAGAATVPNSWKTGAGAETNSSIRNTNNQSRN